MSSFLLGKLIFPLLNVIGNTVIVLTSQYILTGFEKLFVNNQKKKKITIISR